MKRLLTILWPLWRLSGSPKRRTPPRLEPLEDRTLLSVSSLAGAFIDNLLHDASVQPALAASLSSSSHADVNTHSRFGGVGSVFVQTSYGNFLGTGTLVDSRHFVTAAHVLDVDNDGDTDEVQSVSFNLNFGGSLMSQMAALKWTVHHSWTGFGRRSINDDLAVLRLTDDAPSSVPIYSLFTGNLLGQTLTLVGYGMTGTPAGYESGSASLTGERTGQNVAGVVGDYPALGIAAQDDAGGANVNEVWVGDFDGSSDVLGDGASLGIGVETTLGGGDSGGPGFVDVNGQWLLASINTFTTTDAPAFGSALGGMNVAAYADWIQSVVNGDSTPPAPPTGLEATAGSGSVALQWNASTEPDLAGYNVYRSTTPGGDYVRINSSPLTSPFFTDVDVINGVTYFYVVRAIDASGNESGLSSEAFATPQGPPNAPPGLLTFVANEPAGGMTMILVSQSTGAALTTPVVVETSTSTDLRAVSIAASFQVAQGVPVVAAASSSVQTAAGVASPFTLTATRDPRPTLSASALSGGSGGMANLEDAPVGHVPKVDDPAQKQGAPPVRPPDNPWNFWLPRSLFDSSAEVVPAETVGSEDTGDVVMTRERLSDLVLASLLIGFAAGNYSVLPSRRGRKRRPEPTTQRDDPEV